MKIVKHGKPPGNQKHKLKCPNCGTKIECLTSEMKRTTDQRDGDYWSIQCPVCPRMITKAVPQWDYC